MSQFRSPGEYEAFFLGHASPFQITALEPDHNGVMRPHDLTQYSELWARFYANDADASAFYSVQLTPMTTTADKLPDAAGTLVTCRAKGEVKLTGSPRTDMRVKVVGKIGADWYFLDLPWKANAYEAGGTT